MRRCAGSVAQLTHYPVECGPGVNQLGGGTTAVHVRMDALAYVGLASKCLKPVVYVAGMDCGPLTFAGLAKQRPTGLDTELPALVEPSEEQHFGDTAEDTFAIGTAFTIAHMHLMRVEVNVSDIECAEFTAAKPGRIQQAKHCLIAYAQSTSATRLQQFAMFVVNDDVCETGFVATCIHFDRFRYNFCFHAPMLVPVLGLYSSKFSFRYNFFCFLRSFCVLSAIFTLLNSFAACYLFFMATTDKSAASETTEKKKTGRPKGSGKKRTPAMMDIPLGELRSILNDKDSVPVPVGTKWLNQMIELLGR